MFQLPKLNYGFDALEPYIDTKTMEIHYTKHHQAYVDKLNEALGKHPSFGSAQDRLESMLSNLETIPEDIRLAVRNHGGGHFNHSLFWNIIGPAKGTGPGLELKQHLEKQFGSFNGFKEVFTKTALSHFGSGWAWLVKEKAGGLRVLSLPNQDCPLSQGLEPILCLDLWEHAYYLKYQNRRTEYIESFFHVINWSEVALRFDSGSSTL